MGPAAQPGVTRRLDLWNLFHFTAVVVALFFSSISNGIVLTSSPLSYWLSYCLQLLGWTQGVYTERHHCWYFMETERLRGFPGCARGCCTYPFFFLMISPVVYGGMLLLFLWCSLTKPCFWNSVLPSNAFFLITCLGYTLIHTEIVTTVFTKSLPLLHTLGALPRAGWLLGTWDTGSFVCGFSGGSCPLTLGALPGPPSSFCWGVHVVNTKMCDPRSSVLLGGCEDELQLLDLSLSASGFWGALLQSLILITRKSFSNIIAD